MSGHYQAALYLGDVSERVRILKNCGQSEFKCRNINIVITYSYIYSYCVHENVMFSESVTCIQHPTSTYSFF